MGLVWVDGAVDGAVDGHRFVKVFSVLGWERDWWCWGSGGIVWVPGWIQSHKKEICFARFRD